MNDAELIAEARDWIYGSQIQTANMGLYHVGRLTVALAAHQWQPIETAPMDRQIVVWVAPADGLPGFVSMTQWHESAGYCCDELRPVTHWLDVQPPEDGGDGGKGNV